MLFFQCNLDVCHAVNISKPNINLDVKIFELNTGVNVSRELILQCWRKRKEKDPCIHYFVFLAN